MIVRRVKFRRAVGIGGLLDFIEDPISDFLNGGPVGDFLNTPTGKFFSGAVSALAAVASPYVLGELFSGVTSMVGPLATAFSSPLVQQAFPGLLKGERVDVAFVSAGKVIAQRIVSSGGAGATLDAVGQTMSQAATEAAAELEAAFPGVTAATLAAYNDALRIKAGLKLATDELPPAMAQQLAAHVAPYVAALDPKKIANAISASLGIPVGVDVGQWAIDGLTRTIGYDPSRYGTDGNPLVTAAGFSAAVSAFGAIANTAAIRSGAAQVITQQSTAQRDAANAAGYASALAAQGASDAQAIRDAQIVADEISVGASISQAQQAATNTRAIAVVAVAVVAGVIVVALWPK